MPFTLTLEDVTAMLNAESAGDPSLFLARCTPETKIQLGAVLAPGEGISGSYTAENFFAKTVGLMLSVVDPTTVKREYTAVDVVGNKAITESTITAKLLNGDDYYNRFAGFTEFDGETGKIVSLRLYGDTELGYKALTAVGKK